MDICLTNTYRVVAPVLSGRRSAWRRWWRLFTWWAGRGSAWSTLLLLLCRVVRIPGYVVRVSTVGSIRICTIVCRWAASTRCTRSSRRCLCGGALRGGETRCLHPAITRSIARPVRTIPLTITLSIATSSISSLLRWILFKPLILFFHISE